MKLATTSTSPLGEPGFMYEQMPWGDFITGTKEQIQRIGLAVGMAFPGEIGGPKRSLRTADQRGFNVQISDLANGVYLASILFPGREQPSDCWGDFHPGVRKNRGICFDEYVGTAVALSNAGIVRFDQLPGQPGMRKITVTILPDGTLPSGPKMGSREPGAKRIERASKNTYSVTLFIDTEGSRRRDAERQQRDWEYKERMMRLPRPAPLIDLGGDAISSVKAKPAPKYHAEGNVLHLLPRVSGLAVAVATFSAS